MIRSIMFVSALALTAPALAQQAPAETIETPAPVDEAAPVDAPAETATEAVAPAVPVENAPTDVASVVEGEFPTYDADKNGELSKAEFTAWMNKLREADPAAKTADATTWLNTAFAQADADKNKSVSKTELARYLQG